MTANSVREIATFTGQTLAMAAQNETIAVLTTGDIFTTTRTLERYTSEANQRGIRNVAVYDDGSVATITSASVGMYFPGDIEHFDNPTIPTEEERKAAEEAEAEAQEAGEAQEATEESGEWIPETETPAGEAGQ